MPVDDKSNIHELDTADTAVSRWTVAMKAAGSPKKADQAFYESTVKAATGRETPNVSITEGTELTKFFTKVKHFFHIPD